MWAVYILLILLVCNELVDCCFNYGECVYSNLTANYHKQIRPMRSASYIVMVKVQLDVLSLKGINCRKYPAFTEILQTFIVKSDRTFIEYMPTEKEETMEIGGYFRVQWNDHRLAWNPDHYGGVKQIVIPARKIWLPDLVIYNSKTAFYDESYRRDFLVQVNHTGNVLWGYGGVISTSCDINMHDYPFDCQRCDIIMDSWAYSKYQVELDFEGNGIFVNKTAYSNQVWNYAGSKVSSELKYDHNYRRLVFTLNWKRKSLYYHTNIILPIVLLSLVTLGVFWIPVESGDKASLAITVMLAFSVFQIVIMDNTPVNSNVIPKITQYVILVTCMATLTLMTSMIVVYINDRQTNHRPPRILRIILFKYIAKALHVSNKSKLEAETDFKAKNVYKLSTIKKSSKDLRAISRRDRVTRSGSNVVTSNDTVRVLKIIVEQLNDIRDYMEDNDKSEEIKQEWVFVGRIFDRLLFWVTFIGYVIFVIYIFKEEIVFKTLEHV